MGAQKVNTDFNEIEKAMLEQERNKGVIAAQKEYLNKELEIEQQIKNKQEEEKNLEKQMASMKLAYTNLDKQRVKEETKLMQSDPKKASQLERLGMAVGNRSTGISHSAISDMQIIQQDAGSSSRSNNGFDFNNQQKKDFFDDIDNQFFSGSSKSNNGNSYGIRDNDDNNFFKGFNLFLYNKDLINVKIN